MKTLLSTVMSGNSAEDHPSGSPLPVSSMSFGHRASTEAVECPKCGKRSIVERSSNIFDCLNCSFHRELPPVSSRGRSRHTDRSHRGLSSLSHSTRSHSTKPHAHSRGGMRQRGLTQHTILSSSQPGLAPRHSLNPLLSNDMQQASLDRFSLDMGEENIETEESQPWLFAFIAVVFGILLL